MSSEPRPFLDVRLALPDRREGKVRVSYRLPDDDSEGRRLFVTTDRLSAFDRVITGVPYKGQVLNELAAWWFARTVTIVPNHVVAVPDPNALVARTTAPLPVEVVVRAAITGVTATSLWARYDAGARTIDGYHFADGLRKNTLLPEPIVTPTTKPPAGSGAHDEPLAWREVIERGLVERSRWHAVTGAALEVFRLGQEIASAAGLVLADTKYEFGVTASGEVLLIDEVHTPDSSRFWIADSYETRLAAGEEPESLDKEVVRRVLAGQGYRGGGDPPELGPEVVADASRRYVDAFERLTDTAFVPGCYPVEDRLQAMIATSRWAVPA
jgi:phosphoribosylaminoimidazole-succinocarboxamide synthase